ncbi:MAG: nucleoid occlusion protein [Deltaproteobacteria bacterium]
MVLKHLERMLGRDNSARVATIPMEKIKPNPYQPRRNYSEDEMVELAQSIKAYGLIQPVIVREQGDYYQLIAGERRFRACCLLGHTSISALIQPMDDEKAAAVALIENLQRQELNYFEEARAYQVLIKTFGITQEELARRVGRSQSSIANKIRLLRLAPEVQGIIVTHRVTERHARALLRLNSSEMQMEVIQRIYDQDLTVKETEQIVDRLSPNNLPQEIKNRPGVQNIAPIIRDARIFMNTIKETVKRARKTGVDIFMVEKDNDDEYEITIRVIKSTSELKLAARN